MSSSSLAVEQAIVEIAKSVGLLSSVGDAIALLRMIERVKHYTIETKLAVGLFLSGWAGLYTDENGDIIRGRGVSVCKLMKECNLRYGDCCTK
jgi:hypothetical protein